MKHTFTYLLFALILLATTGCKKDVSLAIKLTGYQKMNTVKLQATLISGLYSKQSILERSLDSIHFETIQTIEGILPTTQWIDTTPVANKMNYYRVCNAGFCSNVVEVDYLPLGADGTFIPNLADKLLTVGFDSDLRPYSITIYNRWGAAVYAKQNIVKVKTVIDVSQFPSGTYILYLNDSIKPITKTLAIIH